MEQALRTYQPGQDEDDDLGFPTGLGASGLAPGAPPYGQQQASTAAAGNIDGGVDASAPGPAGHDYAFGYGQLIASPPSYEESMMYEPVPTLGPKGDLAAPDTSGGRQGLKPAARRMGCIVHRPFPDSPLFPQTAPCLAASRMYQLWLALQPPEV